MNNIFSIVKKKILYRLYCLIFAIFIIISVPSYSENSLLPNYNYVLPQEIKTFNFDNSGFKNSDNIIPIVVIGAGPAGLSAGIVTSQDLVKTTIFEGENGRGGPLNYNTPVGNWPGINFSSGKKIIADLYKQVKRFGNVISLVPESVTHVDFTKWPFMLTLNNGTTVSAASVIIATGSSQRFLNVPGEKQYFGHGIYFEVETNFGQNVLVIGGGDDAVRKASELARANKTVTLVLRGNSLKAAKWRQNYVLNNKNINIIYQNHIVEILGDGTKLTGVKLADNKIINVDNIVLAIGRVPNSNFLERQVKLGKDGYILVRPGSHATNIDGIFAAGEVVKVGQAIMASGDGTGAGYEALEFLKKIKFPFTDK